MKTPLAQNQYFPNSGMPNPESAAASKAPPVADATAAPFPNSCSATDAHQSRQRDVRETKRPETDLGIATELQDEPTSSTGGPQRAPAGRAPNTVTPAGALEIDCINEIFFYARKLMKQPARFVLNEAEFMAEIDEVPSFIRDVDGYLRRNA